MYRCLPTRHVYRLTPALFLQTPQPFLLAPPGLLGLLVLPTLVEVLHHHPDEHVEHKEADDEEEGNEVEKHPEVMVPAGLARRPKGSRKRGEMGVGRQGTMAYEHNGDGAHPEDEWLPRSRERQPFDLQRLSLDVGLQNSWSSLEKLAS